MNWAVDEGMIEFNPAHRLRKVGLERPRERVLSETEIKVFWQALERLDTATDDHIKEGKPGRMLSLASRCALRIMLLTGQRRAEVAGIRKSEIDLNGSRPVWTIPSLRTKNRLLHRVPLAPMARAQFEIALAASRANSEYLFPTLVLDGRDAPMIPEAITRAMVRLCAELRISGAGPHDLQTHRRHAARHARRAAARARPRPEPQLAEPRRHRRRLQPLRLRQGEARGVRAVGGASGEDRRLQAVGGYCQRRGLSRVRVPVLRRRTRRQRFRAKADVMSRQGVVFAE